MISQKQFIHLYLENFDGMFFLAFKMLKDKDHANSAVQEAFLNFWRRREFIDPDANPRGYLYRSLRNQALNIIRDNKPRIQEQYRLIKSNQQAYSTNLIFEKELQDIIIVAINKLPKRKRWIYKLKMFGGFTNEQIATKLGISSNTVNLQVSHASKNIKEYLSVTYPEYASYLNPG